MTTWVTPASRISASRRCSSKDSGVVCDAAVRVEPQR